MRSRVTGKIWVLGLWPLPYAPLSLLLHQSSSHPYGHPAHIRKLPQLNSCSRNVATVKSPLGSLCDHSNHAQNPTNVQERKWFPKTVGSQSRHHGMFGSRSLHLLVMRCRTSAPPQGVSPHPRDAVVVYYQDSNWARAVGYLDRLFHLLICVSTQQGFRVGECWIVTWPWTSQLRVTCILQLRALVSQGSG